MKGVFCGFCGDKVGVADERLRCTVFNSEDIHFFTRYSLSQQASANRENSFFKHDDYLFFFHSFLS